MKNNYKTIMLDTPYNTTRALKFYEKAGFKKVTEDELPINSAILIRIVTSLF